jgi:hypothetical protein
MTHTEILQEIQNNAGNPERIYELTKAALAQPTSGDYALGYAEGFNDACKPAQQEPWCMKMNRCTTKCEDCPDEPAPVQQYCFCHSGVSLQSVSGGASPDGYLGRVTLWIDDLPVEYVAAQPDRVAEPAPSQRPWVGLEDDMGVFAALVAAAEREKVATHWEQLHGFDKHAVAAFIRARGETK